MVSVSFWVEVDEDVPICLCWVVGLNEGGEGGYCRVFVVGLPMPQSIVVVSAL